MKKSYLADSLFIQFKICVHEFVLLWTVSLCYYLIDIVNIKIPRGAPFNKAATFHSSNLLITFPINNLFL